MFTADERHQLQSNEANYIHLNAGFRLKITVHSTNQHRTTWRPNWKLVGWKLWEAGLSRPVRNPVGFAQTHNSSDNHLKNLKSAKRERGLLFFFKSWNWTGNTANALKFPRLKSHFLALFNEIIWGQTHLHATNTSKWCGSVWPQQSPEADYSLKTSTKSWCKTPSNHGQSLIPGR